MAEKLKSISKRIHWSSLLKAAVFAAAWLFLPLWFFFLVALYLYFFPVFRVGTLLFPFFALLILTAITGPGYFPALVFGALFYLILIVKDLLILDRRSAYEIIVLALSLLLVRRFYFTFTTGIEGNAFFWAFMTAAAIALVFRNFITATANELPVHEEEADPDRLVAVAGSSPSLRRTAVWLVFVLFTQILIAGLFMPLDFIYQTVIVFLLMALAVDLIGEYLNGELIRNKIIGIGSVIFALFVMILASARWWL